MKYTPMIQQYLQIKHEYEDTVLFFRLGDFYEMFFQDAVTASRELELTLTARDGGGEKVPMCGVPYHSAEIYIGRLIKKNYKVAICDQVESPEESKGIVRREVTRVVTPGTITEGDLIDEKSHNYAVSIALENNSWGLAAADITTGHFIVTQFDGKNAGELLLDELTRLQPKEVLVSQEYNDQLGQLNLNCMITPANIGTNNYTQSKNLIEQHYSIDLEHNELRFYPAAICAAGGLLGYFYDTQKQKLVQLGNIQLYFLEEFMVLDEATRRNLEITNSIIDSSRRGTLLSVLDYTNTAMGGRMLKRWLQQPLMDIEKIEQRQEAVQEIIDDIFFKESIRSALDLVYDLERLSSKLASGNANARDLTALKQSLGSVPDLKSILSGSKSVKLSSLSENMDELAEIYDLLDKSIVRDPPVSSREGGIICSGYNEEVDNLRNSSTNGKKWLTELENREKNRTGIKSLKIGYNKVFGYYIEVTRANLQHVPGDYIRKQTLVNAERYITPDLKEYENLILGAEDRLVQLEYEIFCNIRNEVLNAVSRLQQTSECIARVDALWSLAESALRNYYVRPLLNNSKEIKIKEGRHAVVEAELGAMEFVPNDAYMEEKEFLLLITGPNMAGKSTYMRQTALIVLMAQVGSFVPAEEALIGIVDRIFTRVGAADDLAGGRSTFMVEMTECRTIMEYASDKSLIIMDEVGRGTSTYDGISLARAMVHYIHDKIKARTLFSTHYHELTDLEILSSIKNYTIAVQEQGDDIVFLRKLKPGKADRSYGIHVARLAGIPEEILKNACSILDNLENYQSNMQHGNKQQGNNNTKEITYEKHPVLDKLKNKNILEMTPLDALNFIYKLQEELQNY
ncbi:MAG: DNA mismatch repair protein MutS [Clostridiales bacterium]|nr:DNA mismatch repair protein MutS [Clostridiales bacterium]MCF8023264.1 DNA mismatch repair protein MutS [Clostridiales bacterium]